MKEENIIVFIFPPLATSFVIFLALRAALFISEAHQSPSTITRRSSL